MLSKAGLLLVSACLGLPGAFAASTPAPAAPTPAATPAVPGKKGDTKFFAAKIPEVAASPEAWQKLIPALLDNHMPYGAMSASRNMLSFFADLPTKELAYGTIIRLADLGYPFTTRSTFVAGDLDPNASTDFGRNYFFYKGVVNLDQKMQKWADAQFRLIDKEHFPKYLYFKALGSYADGKLDDAIATLKEALTLTTGKENESLARKEARTLARLYYEQKEYAKSLDIYDSFLLKAQPMEPGDWLESAWCLYGLKRFPESLGRLYNLESKTVGRNVLLEKYILRALVYRESCATDNVKQLAKDFTRDFGKLADRIRLGEPLRPEEKLIRIENPATLAYRQAAQSAEELTRERANFKQLPKDVLPLAEYLYTAEVKMFARQKKMREDDALQAQARQLVILGESLRFLNFDVVREKISPAKVFAPPPERAPAMESKDEVSFRIHWNQRGDYWRDERMLYRGEVGSQCEQ